VAIFLGVRDRRNSILITAMYREYTLIGASSMCDEVTFETKDRFVPEVNHIAILSISYLT